MPSLNFNTTQSSNKIIILLFMLGFIYGCSVQPNPTTPVTESTSYWPRSTPEDVGMDSVLLAEMLETIQRDRSKIDSVLVIRSGKLVLDAYNHPFSEGQKHNLFSITKSVLSALIGIAIEQGYIENLNQTVLEFFPDRSINNLDQRKEAMTLEDLITMTSGIKCRDSYVYNGIGLREMRDTDDWLQHVLDLPMEAPPGAQFEYCNGASLLLSAVLQEAAGMKTADFARQNLFLSLGIDDFDWNESPEGVTTGWSGLHLQPVDIARFGQLFLNEGIWGGEQVIMPDWVKISTQQHVAGTLQDGYGYYWWIVSPEMYMGLGYGGQFLIVLPEEQIVVVFTSSLSEQDFYLPQRLMEKFILPAIGSSEGALPENPNGNERLQKAIEALASPETNSRLDLLYIHQTFKVR